jgi:hypothetical protein
MRGVMDTVTDTVLAAVMEQLGFKSPAPQPGSIGPRYSFLPFKYWGLCYSNGKFLALREIKIGS